MIAKEGSSEIVRAFNELFNAAIGTALNPRGVYGKIYEELTWAHKNDPSFDPFKNLLRSHIFALWPVGPETKILGRSIPERRIHSLTTAAKELRVSEKLLDSLLTEAGAFSKDDQRRPRQKTFGIEPFQDFLNEIPYLISPKKMRQCIGATETEMRSLIDDGLLQPRTNSSSVKAPWSEADGIAFLEKIDQLVRKVVPMSEQGWIRLQAAKTLARMPLSMIIQCVEYESLVLAKYEGATGFHNYLVSMKQLGEIIEHRRAMQLSVEGTLKKDLIPAAAFGRQVGIRGRHSFLEFVRDGHTPGKKVRNSINGLQTWYLSADDIEGFRDRFITIRMITEEIESHRNTVIAVINAHKTLRFMPGGKDYGPIYLRADVEILFPSLSK